MTEEHYPQQQPTPSRATDPNLAHATAGEGRGEGVSGRRVEPSGQGGEAISSPLATKAQTGLPGPTFTPRSVRLPGSAPTPRADRLRYAEEEGANRARTGTREMRHGRQEGTGAPPKVVGTKSDTLQSKPLDHTPTKEEGSGQLGGP